MATEYMHSRHTGSTHVGSVIILERPNSNSNGKNNRDGYPQGKGYGNASPIQCHMVMAMRATKGCAESNPNLSAQGQGTKRAGKGKGKSDDRERYNRVGRGHIARDCPHSKSAQNSSVPCREAAHDKGAGLVFGACAIESVQISSAHEEQPVVFTME